MSYEVEAWSFNDSSARDQMHPMDPLDTLTDSNDPALLVDQTFLGKLQCLNPSFVLSLNPLECEFVNTLEEKGDSVGETMLSGASFFYKGVALAPQTAGEACQTDKISLGPEKYGFSGIHSKGY